jgi:oligopeptidase B
MPTDTAADPYAWLRDDTRSRPEVLGFLAREQEHYAAESGAWSGLIETLTAELVARIPPDDDSVPFRDRGYLYWTRHEAGREHPIFLRRSVAGGPAEVMLDANREAAGNGFYAVGAWEVSADERTLAFLADASGRRQYTLELRDLATGRSHGERIPGLSASLAWARDGVTVFYVENDPTTLLSTRVKRHRLGTDPALDAVVYEEQDTSYYLRLETTADRRFVLIVLESTTASEVLAIDAERPTAAPRSLAPRERGVRYHADHVEARWVIRTDWCAPNERLMMVGDDEVGDRRRWRELVPHDPAVFLESFRVFRDFLAINERRDGVLGLRTMPWPALDQASFLHADEPVSTATFEVNAEVESPTLRYVYSSPSTPPCVYDVDMRSGAQTLRKRQAVLGGFRSEDYVSERVWAPARDGRRIPVSIVHRRGLPRDGSAPLYQTAYGAYGISFEPAFVPEIVSLLDRGVVYAIAHVRGGQELGRAWYEEGKLLAKRNTFTDFIDVTDHLVALGVAAHGRVVASGASAGGLLMGVIANEAPEKYRAIVARVPFVDALATMLDESIPLTSNEFDEWGNPKVRQFYDAILAYSPYDNVRAQDYPALLVTTALHDSQVQYFEPAKWVAKLRARKTDRNPLLFKVHMEAGHGGRSGRYERLRDVAEEYAFLLTQLGIDR